MRRHDEYDGALSARPDPRQKEHNSVPFHMDGSYRAAIDLDP